jgi:hypothetical protein
MCCAKFLGVSPTRYHLFRRLNKARSLTRLTFQITHATDSDTNAERDYIVGQLRKNRSIEAEQVYQAGENLLTERVNHYITDGEVMLARLVVDGD